MSDRVAIVVLTGRGLKLARRIAEVLPGAELHGLAVVVGCAVERGALALLDADDLHAACAIVELELPGRNRLVARQDHVDGLEADGVVIRGGHQRGRHEG